MTSCPVACLRKEIMMTVRCFATGHARAACATAACLLAAACGSASAGPGAGGGGQSASAGGAIVSAGAGAGGGEAPQAGAAGTLATDGGAGATGVAGGSGAIGLGGGTSGGSGGSTGGTAGGGTSGAAADMDTPPPRPLNVTASPARYEHTFRTKDADPTVTFNDNTEIAVVDNRASKLMAKLVLPFQGEGTTAGTMGAGGDFCAHRGFHVLAIAAFQNYNIVIGDANFYGDARKEVFEGIEYTHTGDFATIHMTPADGVEQRTQKALQYLDKLYPTEDWGYYLNADGSVRWSDVIFEGMSHGASNAARFAMLVRASRVVSIAGPRDNVCTSLNASNCGGVIGNWLYEVPKTPIDRFYALTGVTDSQHLQHLFAMQLLKYVGQPVSVIGGQAPYGDSHRLNASGGHTDYCSEASYEAACNYLFGVPTENQNGTP
jgi:hypothetical protein